jgi:hypothetical protein
MELQFQGKISEIRKVRTGTTEKGEWANAEFEVTENSDKYPQVALFDFFKNGEHVKYAKEFADYHKVGDEVIVHFNLKKTSYTNKKGEPAAFYKTSAWKIEKVNNSVPAAQIPAGDMQEEEDDLPF